MRYITLLFCTACLFLFYGCNKHYAPYKTIDSYRHFPSYKMVANKLFTEYDTKDLINESILQIARKKKGWYIRLQNRQTKQIIEQCFWKAETNSWQALSLAVIPPEQVNDTNVSYLNQYLADTTFFDLNLFYGYQGWERDAIDVISSVDPDSLKDKDLYQIGRAYSSLATYIIWPNIRYPDENTHYDSTWSGNDISEKQLSAFDNASDSAIYYYKKLKQLNPFFQTFVGSANDSYSNEHLTAYYHLKIIGKTNLGKKYLVDGLYDDFILSYYKNMLLSCDPNTVLFTFGDTDTYALTYLQDHMGIRKDVTVVIRTFLLTGRYINYLTNLLPENERIDINTKDTRFWKSLDNYYICYNNSINHADEFVKETVATNLEMTRNDGNCAISGYLFLQSAARKIPGSINADTTLEWNMVIPDKFTNESAFTKADLFFIDFFSKNALKRPVAYLYPSGFFWLDDHLSLNGLVYEVNIGKKENTEEVYNKMMNTFTYGKLDTNFRNGQIVTMLTNSYAGSFYHLVNELQVAGKNEMAKNVLDKYYTLFPDNVLPLSDKDFYLIEKYYQLGDNVKADNLVSLLVGNTEKSFFKSLNIEEYDINRIQQKVSTINAISDGIEKYNSSPQTQAQVKKVKEKMEAAYNAF